MKKRFMALVLALVLCVGLAVPALAEGADAAQTPAGGELTAAAYSTGAAPKGLLLFVGYQWDKGETKYPQYTAADIQKLSEATSEFILCTGNTQYNSYQFNSGAEQQIITEQLINDLPCSLIASPDTLNAIKADYLSILKGSSSAILQNGEQTHVNELLGRLDPSWQASKAQKSVSPYYQSLLGNLDPSMHRPDAGSSSSRSWVDSKDRRFFKLDDLASDVVNQLKIIVSANPDAVIWLPFPHISFPSFAAQYKQPFTQYVDALKSSLGTTVWARNIRGLYWGTEAVTQYYTPFYYGSPANGFGNPVVQLMTDIDSLISQDSKQFLWIPYLGESGTVETMQRNGYVANWTGIFDYAMFQASYYFNAAAACYENLSLIQKSVLADQLYNRDNTVFGGWKSGSTAIGYAMELDEAVINRAGNDRYWYYTHIYADLKNDPHVFYAGDRSSICGTTSGAKQCFTLVKLWLAQ